MIPSFVSGRPTGEETGRYLALDLGGTNLRVCEFSLEGNGKYSAKQQKFVVSEDLKRGEFRYLCDYIADCVDTFITEHGSLEDSDGELQLGFTFSFPVWQTEINRGVLKQWTKGFSCPGAVNKDVTIMLQDAFRKKNIPVHIAAVSFPPSTRLFPLIQNLPGGGSRSVCGVQVSSLLNFNSQSDTVAYYVIDRERYCWYLDGVCIQRTFHCNGCYHGHRLQRK